ncbi:hypothetical protein K443DRAFT_9104 [Laccaria amethystina LaAM-08-1]|uniref:Uncharacterized protein n=1 Tax=Laccaria amethystina LaAM-08-1 TaxID=1095629 RepID=A0A0C9X075_9AGAR|nr:hypothetical protein K443DRAFT_9104 [Laccaria amethystina LaAM-08-1]
MVIWSFTTTDKKSCRCDALRTDLNGKGSHRCSHKNTDFLIKNFDLGILWDDFGIRHDIVPFTHGFPQADIHELLSPDLLHQLIKGIFKDHLVDWVGQYLYQTHGKTVALEIIEDIDHRISAVPPYPGLRRFPDGHDYNQWTGDDSKALMKVFLAAIAGYLPSSMVQCISAFMNACYITRRNAGVRVSISLPHQHALFHYYNSIQLFGSPNGLCSSITESKHIKAMKEPWRRSSQYHALIQMLQTLQQLDQMAALRHIFSRAGMLAGSTSSYMAGGDEGSDLDVEVDNDEEKDDGGPIEDGLCVLSEVKLATKHQYGYPHKLNELSDFIRQPQFSLALSQFLFMHDHPDRQVPSRLEDLPLFEGNIKVYHSAVAVFYSPSDTCGPHGMHHERIHSSPSFYGHEHQDTVFVVLDDSKKGMEGMEIDFSCALINWFVHDDEPDVDTGMWTVQLECDWRGEPTVEVIDLDTIAQGAHLLPIFGSSKLR